MFNTVHILNNITFVMKLSKRSLHICRHRSDYCNDPKFLDRQVLANSADPDQTAPRGSGSSLFAIPFVSS